MSFYSNHLPTLKFLDRSFFFSPLFDHDNSSFELCVFYFSQTQAILLKFTDWLGVFFTHIDLSWQHVSFFFFISFLFCILHIFLSHFSLCVSYSTFDEFFCFASRYFDFFSNWIFLDAANIIINFLSRYLIRLVYEFDWIVRARANIDYYYLLFVICVFVRSKNNNNNYNNNNNNDNRKVTKETKSRCKRATTQHCLRRQRSISMYVLTSVWVVNNKHGGERITFLDQTIQIAN